MIPYAKATVAGRLALNLFFVRGGIEVLVIVVQFSLPATTESFSPKPGYKLSNPHQNQCRALNFKVETLGGKISGFVDTFDGFPPFGDWDRKHDITLYSWSSPENMVWAIQGCGDASGPDSQFTQKKTEPDLSSLEISKEDLSLCTSCCRLKDITHDAYLGMCGSDNSCAGSNYGLKGYKKVARGQWKVAATHTYTGGEWEVADEKKEKEFSNALVNMKKTGKGTVRAYLQDATEGDAYMGMCGTNGVNEKSCSGSVTGVRGYKSKPSGRGEWEITANGDGTYSIIQAYVPSCQKVTKKGITANLPCHNAYLAMCGDGKTNDKLEIKSCGGFDHGVKGYRGLPHGNKGWKTGMKGRGRWKFEGNCQVIASCWIRMPTGCDKVLSETSQPTVWFIDPSNTGDACQSGRLQDFNKYCGRSDAEQYWGSVAPDLGACKKCCRIKEADHNAYLGMCGIDDSCGGSNYGLKGFPGTSSERGTWQMTTIGTEQTPEPLSTLTMKNFNDRGNSRLSPSTTYTYTLANGYTAKLSGWTHTRTYAKGFLRNGSVGPGNAKAVVEGLHANSVYKYKVYQFASKFGGNNTLSVEGRKFWTVARNSDDATLQGQARANAHGKITFVFERNSHHVHLSGLALGLLPGLKVTLKDTTHKAYMGMCGRDSGCSGSDYGVKGYRSKPSGRGEWEIHTNGDGTYSIKDYTADHNAYLAMCGVESCSGSKYGVKGYVKKPSKRGRWIFESC